MKWATWATAFLFGALVSAQVPTAPVITLLAATTTTTSAITIGTGASSYGGFSTAVIPDLKPSKPTAAPVDNSTSVQAQANPYVPNGPGNRGNWQPGWDINTDYTKSWPNTGQTVRYTLRIQNRTMSPEGIPKQMLVVNGQYPGPKIEANWGDTLEITVVNELSNNGTSIHWHGFRMYNTNLQDGVNGVTECPIAPGDFRVYRFKATQYGTSWYHSHFSIQYGDGVLGPIVINGPASANYDLDLGTVMVSDFYRGTAYQEDALARRRGPPTAINYLLNGQNMRIDGKSGTRPKWTFQPGKKHRLRLINVAIDMTYKMQIDGHRFQVIQADFVPIIPYYTNELVISAGQRYDVIVEATKAPGNYWFRAMSADDCSFTLNKGTSTFNGIISYANAPSPNALPTSSNWPHTNTCVDEPAASLIPVVPKSVDAAAFQKAASQLPVNLERLKDAQGVFYHWTIGGIAQVVDWTNPTVLQASLRNNSYIKERNAVVLNQRNVWTYWVLQNQFFVPHPIHLHGHDFSLLGQGNGDFNLARDVSKLNFKNPPRRDVALLVSKGWTVIAFQTDNPGAWLMHCHIAWHATEGLSMQFVERPQDIPALYGSEAQGSVFTNKCNNWKRYAANAIWKQYDSGLKRRTLEDGTEGLELEPLPPRRGLATRASRAEVYARKLKEYFQ